jgi:hypothetical protein
MNQSLNPSLTLDITELGDTKFEYIDGGVAVGHGLWPHRLLGK